MRKSTCKCEVTYARSLSNWHSLDLPPMHQIASFHFAPPIKIFAGLSSPLGGGLHIWIEYLQRNTFCFCKKRICVSIFASSLLFSEKVESGRNVNNLQQTIYLEIQMSFIPLWLRVVKISFRILFVQILYSVYLLLPCDEVLAV